MKSKIILLMFLVAACGGKPQKFSASPVQLPKTLIQKAQKTGYAGVWLGLTNYTSGGSLSRLDLDTAILEHSVLATGPDVKLVQADRARDPGRFYLLTRNTNDALAVYQTKAATLEKKINLAAFSNPQATLKDSQGRYWVANYASNIVDIYNSSLSANVGSVDLSTLHDAGDPLAELGSMTSFFQGGVEKIAVSAQRIDQTTWTPDPYSGVGVINGSTLAIERLDLVPAPNPAALHAEGDNLMVAGSGNLGSVGAQNGVFYLYSLLNGLVVSQQPSTGKLLGVSFGVEGEDLPKNVSIRWMMADNKSCLDVNGAEFLCQSTDATYGGYVFKSVLVSNEVVFVSVTIAGDSELWIVPLDHGEIKKVELPMPLESVILGP